MVFDLAQRQAGNLLKGLAARSCMPDISNGLPGTKRIRAMLASIGASSGDGGAAPAINLAIMPK